MSRMARDRYLEPYRRAVAWYGDTFDVTLWANEHAQQRRFEVFTELCDLAGKRVLDAGCSRGDLAAFLIQRDIAYESYVGIDGVDQVITFARQRELARARFYCGDILHDARLLSCGRPQVICISGTLNTMTDRQVTTVLESAWAATGQTLLFNFLSDLARRPAPPQSDPARRMSTARLLQWAAARTGRIIYRQDYLRFGHDATIMMTRDEGRLTTRPS